MNMYKKYSPPSWFKWIMFLTVNLIYLLGFVLIRMFFNYSASYISLAAAIFGYWISFFLYPLWSKWSLKKIWRT